jgi:two-component system LytT family response regulator
VIRALIVDDEPLARARVRRLLSAEPDVEIVGECVDGRGAMAALASRPVDLMVLDIEMPEVDGFAVTAAAAGPAIIFVTAHEQYARRAFDADAVDYLLKPVEPERIAESLARVRRRMERAAGEGAAMRIPARTGNRIRFVAAGDIEWIEAQGNYAALHAAGRAELVRETMASLERRLDPGRFARIHRGLIVRIDRICELAPHATGEYTVRLEDGVDRKHTRLHSSHVLSSRMPSCA